MDLTTLLYFVGEREAIRIKREAGQQPVYTHDPILQRYRFTNVRRRHDRVSRWLQQNVLIPSRYVSMQDFMLFSALCRWINWPPTIANIIEVQTRHKPDWRHSGIDWVRVKEAMHYWGTLNGMKVWTGAYMVRGFAEFPTKVDGVIDGAVLGSLRGRAGNIFMAINEQTRQAVWKEVEQCKFWGSFMAGQIVDDWTWTPAFKADDEFTWAPQGPGSRRGLNRLLGRGPLTASYKSEEFCKHLIEIRDAIIAKLGDSFSDVTLMDVQNVLCEVDKYLRVKNGEGRPRASYVSHAGIY